jgi:histidyl-tRNA synthetase
MKIQRCKGMRDMSPAEVAVFHLVEEICRDCFSKWGYQEVKTPTIEYLHLFTSAGTLTPGRLGKVYSFLDWDGWSGERVVLRPDGTIPVARMYTEKMQEQGLARLFYAANMFIFEETGEKARERWQCGAELIGAGSAIADAELIAISTEIIKKLGLKGVELKLSHAGLIKALLKKIGLSPEEQHKLFDRIMDGDAEALAKVSRESSDFGSTLLPLLKLKGQSTAFLRNQMTLLRQSAPEICASLADFIKTVSILDELGLKYQINIASGAGFEYYTGIIFQYFTGREKIGGGGRYDALIPSMGGGDAPASGFALYLDSLMNLVGSESFYIQSPARVLVKALSSDAVKETFKAAESLRKAGYIAELDLDGQKADWTLEVKRGGALILENKAKSVKTRADNIGEVIKLLEGQSAG